MFGDSTWIITSISVPVTPPKPDIITVIMFMGMFIPGRMFTRASNTQPVIRCSAIFRAVLPTFNITFMVK